MARGHKHRLDWLALLGDAVRSLGAASSGRLRHPFRTSLAGRAARDPRLFSKPALLFERAHALRPLRASLPLALTSGRTNAGHWRKMQWLSSVAEAATSAVSTIQQTIEAEKNEFIEEYNTVRSDVPPSKTAASSTAGASSTEGGTDSALQNLRRVGWAMLNPLEDQDSLKPEEVGPSVVMLPWEAPGLSEPVRVRMRALSQEPAVFLSPPQAEESFDFKMESSLSLVVEALSVDKHLEKQRHLLVPLQVRPQPVLLACAVTDHVTSTRQHAPASTRLGAHGPHDDLTRAGERVRLLPQLLRSSARAGAGHAARLYP